MFLDLHGSTRLVTDADETVTDGYNYDGYGELTAQAGSTQNNYLYSGLHGDAGGPGCGFGDEYCQCDH